MSEPDLHLATPSKPRAASGTLAVRVLRATLQGRVEQDDRVAVEAPLEFLLHHPALGPEPASFGTTMRTPGDDEWLAAGLLYGEGIVNHASDIDAIESSTRRPERRQCPIAPDRRCWTCRRRRGASRPGRAAACAARRVSMPPSRVPPPPASCPPGASNYRCCCVCRTGCARHNRSSAIPAAFTPRRCSICRARCSAWPRMSAGTMPSTSSWGRICLASRLPLSDRVVLLERAREFRTGSKGAARGRLGARRHRCAFESCGQSRRGIRSHAGGIFARESLQRVFESSTPHGRWTLISAGR